MPLKKYLTLPAVAVFAGLCAASLACEVMRVHADAALFHAHQARWDCLARESAKVPRCRELAKRKPEDADYCEEAVSSCTASGTYADVDNSVERYFMWLRLAGLLRAALLVATFGSLAWIGIVRPIRRRLRSR